MDPTLETEPVETFVPIRSIESLLTKSLSHSVITGNHLRQIEYTDYNYAIELSVRNLFSEEIPLSLLQAAMEPDYIDSLYRYIDSQNKKKGTETPFPPKEQVIYQGTLDALFCYQLHLANVYPNELHICFIGLQNPLQTQYDFGSVLTEEYKGLGNGIFDTIFHSIEDYARTHSYQEITLRAANDLLRSVYERRGYICDTDKPSSIYHSMKKNVS